MNKEPKIEVTFIAENFKVSKRIQESKIEKFRKNMLAKYKLLFKIELNPIPHLIKIKYE